MMSQASPSDDSGHSAGAPRTYLGWAVAATVLCFLPLGLVALFFGLRTSSAVADGRLDDAVRSSRRARRWIVATVIVGGLTYLAIVGSLLLLGAFST